jgi:hypothetical protein
VLGLSGNLSRDVLVAILAIVIGAAAIGIGIYIILTDLATYSQSNMPIPAVSVARNWAGYVAASDLNNPQGVAAGVSGQWIVPTVTDIGQDAFSAVWVGIGGEFDQSLIQTGTEQDITGGSPTYYAWYELLPDDSVTIDSMPVSPGDQMAAAINLVDPANNVWTISLADLTTGQKFENNFTYNSQQLTAEWIVERPDVNNALSQLANFGNVTFSNCQANLGKTGAVTDFANGKIIMDNQVRRGQSIQLVAVSDISPQGAQFTVSYLG